MLGFSSTAFSMLESAMAVIFFQRVRIQRRNFLVSAIIPYLYIFVIGLGIVLVPIIVDIDEIRRQYHAAARDERNSRN